METIINYFDHIFMALPPTAEVQKAKNELLSMAEDRYHELKENGKSENEAVGTVIEEFGNIDELAADLGVDFETTNLENEHFFSRKDVETFLDTYERADRQLGLGIFLLALSPFLLIILGLLNSGVRPIVSPAVIGCVGVPFLLLFVAVGLCLIIFPATAANISVIWKKKFSVWITVQPFTCRKNIKSSSPVLFSELCWQWFF